MNLDNKTVVITGAARGLGAAIAKGLASQGADVALVDLDTSDKMRIVLQEILQDKIYLDTSDEVKITGEVHDSSEGPEIQAGDV